MTAIPGVLVICSPSRLRLSAGFRIRHFNLRPRRTRERVREDRILQIEMLGYSESYHW
jgi:hypothetical protein